MPTDYAPACVLAWLPTVFDVDNDKQRAAWEMEGSTNWQADSVDATNGFSFEVGREGERAAVGRCWAGGCWGAGPGQLRAGCWLRTPAHTPKPATAVCCWEWR